MEPGPTGPMPRVNPLLQTMLLPIGAHTLGIQGVLRRHHLIATTVVAITIAAGTPLQLGHQQPGEATHGVTTLPVAERQCLWTRRSVWSIQSLADNSEQSDMLADMMPY